MSLLDSNGIGSGRKITNFIAAGSLFVTIAGSLLWSLVSLHAEISDNQRWLSDLQRVVDHYIQEQGKWDSDEREYDHEVRQRIDGVDHERQEAFRALWEKITELMKKCQ